MVREVITDEIWEILKPLLPKPKGRHGKNDRMFLEAVCWILRTGSPWRDLPLDLFRNSQHQLQIVNTCYQVKS